MYKLVIKITNRDRRAKSLSKISVLNTAHSCLVFTYKKRKEEMYAQIIVTEIKIPNSIKTISRRIKSNQFQKQHN